jgi:hypothetical protein
VSELERQLPYDGPHSRDSVIAAADGMAYLVRYLNNATQPVTARHTLAWSNTIDEVVSRIKAAVYGMDQLFDQLGAAARAAAKDPTLYDARAALDVRHQEGAKVALQLADRLNEIRRLLVVWEEHRPVGGLAAELDHVHSMSTRLGNEDGGRDLGERGRGDRR